MTASECMSAFWHALFHVSSLRGLSIWEKVVILALKVMFSFILLRKASTSTKNGYAYYVRHGNGDHSVPWSGDCHIRISLGQIPCNHETPGRSQAKKCISQNIRSPIIGAARVSHVSCCSASKSSLIAALQCLILVLNMHPGHGAALKSAGLLQQTAYPLVCLAILMP